MSQKCKMKFFNMFLRFPEKQFWIFVKYV